MEKQIEKEPEKYNDVESGSDTVSVAKGDILSAEHTDPVLNAKMHLVNNVSLNSYLLSNLKLSFLKKN